MAKKKKKAAKKAAKKKTSEVAGAVEATAAETGSCSDQQLVDADVLTAGGELMAGLANGLFRELESRGIDIAELLRTAAGNLQCSPASESVSGEEDSQRGWEYARRQLERRDFADMPYLRVIGRVLNVLLNHRRFETCTTGDIFLVFLKEMPLHLEENHRQNQRSDGSFDVTMQPARRTFNNRMDSLRDDDLVRATVTRGTGREEGYMLTEDGQNMFNGWPDLRDIPGLELQGPVTPENCARRQPRRRS